MKRFAYVSETLRLGKVFFLITSDRIIVIHDCQYVLNQAEKKCKVRILHVFCNLALLPECQSRVFRENCHQL